MNEAELKAIITEDAEGWEAVTSEEITDQSRWSTFYHQVFKRTEDGTFWAITWSRGSTEYQDEGIEGPEITQVKPVEKTVTVYE